MIAKSRAVKKNTGNILLLLNFLGLSLRRHTLKPRHLSQIIRTCNLDYITEALCYLFHFIPYHCFSNDDIHLMTLFYENRVVCHARIHKMIVLRRTVTYKIRIQLMGIEKNI